MHKIEAHTLDELPGAMVRYASWSEMVDGMRDAGSAAAKKIAMQYSPNCAIPYVAMVDAGTVELVRGLGVEIVRLGESDSVFRSALDRARSWKVIWKPGAAIDRVRREAFERIGASSTRGARVTEWDIKQFILDSLSRRMALFTDHGPDVAVNANASNPHYDPTQDACSEIQQGDLVLIDMWAKLDQPDERVLRHHLDRAFAATQAAGRDASTCSAWCARRAIARSIASRMRWRRSEDLRGFEVDDAARALHSRGRASANISFIAPGHSIGDGHSRHRREHGQSRNARRAPRDSVDLFFDRAGGLSAGIRHPQRGEMFVDEKSARVTGEMQRELLLI